MNRYSLTVYLDNKCLFYQEFSSITKVAKFIDCFNDVDTLWFDLVDIYKDQSISVRQLMEVWHA